jgi:ubiquinone/menaquinone biosynthesis C-methylase UbiE
MLHLTDNPHSQEKTYEQGVAEYLRKQTILQFDIQYDWKHSLFVE